MVSVLGIVNKSHNVGVIFWFRLPAKCLDVSKYFGLYKFVLCMGTDQILKAMAIH